MGLATEAAIALENARLYSAAHTQAQELDTIFESIADGITLVDEEGNIVRENRMARRLREKLESAEEKTSDQPLTARMLLQKTAGDNTEQGVQVAIIAARTGAPHASVHREIERAEQAGLVVSRKLGNTRLVRANTASRLLMRRRLLSVVQSSSGMM